MQADVHASSDISLWIRGWTVDVQNGLNEGPTKLGYMRLSDTGDFLQQSWHIRSQ